MKRHRKGIIREKNYNFPEQDEDIETGLFNKTKEHSISVPAVQFLHSYYLLGRWLFLPDCSWWVGKEHPVTVQTCSLPATTTQLRVMPHPLLVSSPLPTDPSPRSRKILPWSQRKVSLSPSWADPLILAYAAKLYPTLIGSWLWKYCAWSIFLLATYLLSFPLWHLPCCLKR